MQLMQSITEIRLIGARNSKALAEEIASKLEISLCDVRYNLFSDGEFQPMIEDSVRGAHVFIVQSSNQPSDNFMELLMLIDACARASAKYISVVMPYYGYARQDRKDRPRVSIAAKLVANLITSAGASRVMTMDLHADQIQGFFDIPLDHIFGSAIFVPYIQSLNLENLSVASPDVGSTKRTRFYAQQFNCDMVICDKYRKTHNQVSEMNLIGDVQGKNVVLIDDIIDTGRTLCLAAKIIKDSGALSVRAICTHPVLSGSAQQLIQDSVLDELVVTNSIALLNPVSKIKILSVADLFAEAIKNTFEYKSINSLFVKHLTQQ
ncbi:MAG: ribose-phosphate pyrophosphokinase [Chitinophagales bacterium]|jgi:ribose-phosphate pyrophosphokinase|nr:ribose-phosphate pyrophosphokinase [Chitinophagales bacterium]